MFRILICVMFVLNAQASIVMMEVSTNGVEITSTYNPHPTGAGAVVSSGVSLEITSDAIVSESIAFVPSSPSYPDSPAPATIEIQDADVVGVNGIYTLNITIDGYPHYIKDDSYLIAHDFFGWHILVDGDPGTEYYISGQRHTFPPKTAWYKIVGETWVTNGIPTLIYEGGMEPTSAPPDMVVEAGPTTNFPAVFADFAPTVAPESPLTLTPEVAEFTRQADAGDTIALTGEEL